MIFSAQDFEKFLQKKLATINKGNIDEVMIEVMTTLENILQNLESL